VSVLAHIFPRPGRRPYSRGMQLFNRMEYAQAAVEFDRLLAREKRPGSLDAKLARFYSAEAHAKIGISCYLGGDLSRARGEFDRALQVQGHYPDLYAYLGTLDARDGRWTQAKENLDKSLLLCPTQREALAARIVVHECLGQSEAADRDWQHFRVLGPARPPLLPHQPRPQVTPHRLQALRSEGAHEAVQAFLEQYDLGDWERALMILERAILDFPSYADLQYRRGLLLAELNRLPDAILALEVAVTINPRFVNALLAQGLCFLTLCRWSDAAGALSRALREEPQFADVAYAHAVAAFALRELEEASTSLSAALAVNPRFWRARVAMSLIDFESNRKEDALAGLKAALSCHMPQGPLLRAPEHPLERREAGAIAFWSAAVLSHPEYPDLHLQLGLAELHRGGLERAAAAFSQAIHLHPAYGEAHAGLGKVAMRAGDFDRAVLHFTRALDLSPRWADVWCLLAEARVEMGELSSAAADFEQSLAQNPGYVNALLGLAIVRSRQRRADEARGLVERILRQCPGHPIATGLMFEGE
jgi:tetratricopeptide (TPR) repeat protein